MYYQKSFSFLFTSLYLVLSYITPGVAQESNNNPSTEPNTPDSSAREVTKFNSSANPLLFPTKPEEVSIEKQQSVTLDEAIEIALKNNKDLQAARLELQRSEDGLRASLGAQLPTIDTQLDFNQRGDDVPATEDTFISRDRTQLLGQIEVGYESLHWWSQGCNY